MSDSCVLTQAQADRFREAVPRLIRSACCGESGAPEVCMAGLGDEGAKRLCYPLSTGVLARIHRCTVIRTRTVDITCHRDYVSERRGVLTFRAVYHFEGTESSGAQMSLHEEGWIFVRCTVLRTGLHRELLCITGVEGYPADGPLPDKTDTPASELPPSPRKARKRLRLDAAKDEAKGCCWDEIIDSVLAVIDYFI